MGWLPDERNCQQKRLALKETAVGEYINVWAFFFNYFSSPYFFVGPVAIGLGK